MPLDYRTRKDGRVYIKRHRLSKQNIRIIEQMRALDKKFKAERLEKFLEAGRPTKVAKSSVHGYGIFSTRAIAKGETIAEPPRNPGYNHSSNPNAEISGPDKTVALRDIVPDEEITINYADRMYVGRSAKLGREIVRGRLIPYSLFEDRIYDATPADLEGISADIDGAKGLTLVERRKLRALALRQTEKLAEEI